MPFFYVAGAVAIIGAGVSAYSSYSQAQDAKAADEYNEKVADQNAISAEQQGQEQAQLQQQQAAKTIGAAVAGYGASGVESGSGSALDVLSESASNSELDRQNILYKAKLQANGYQDEGDLDSAKAATRDEQGELGATAAILSGAGKAAGDVGAGNEANDDSDE
jgi:hypothetical protein